MPTEDFLVWLLWGHLCAYQESLTPAPEGSLINLLILKVNFDGTIL